MRTRLGLSGQVERQPFFNLCGGRHPVDGRRSPLASAPTAPLYRLARRRHSGSAPALPRLRTQPGLGCRGGTVEGRTIPSARRTGPYFEQVFHARLAVGLRRLGYGIAERGRGWEIAGGPASVLQKFSRRTAVPIRQQRTRASLTPRRKAGSGRQRANARHAAFHATSSAPSGGNASAPTKRPPSPP